MREERSGEVGEEEREEEEKRRRRGGKSRTKKRSWQKENNRKTRLDEDWKRKEGECENIIESQAKERNPPQPHPLRSGGVVHPSVTKAGSESVGPRLLLLCTLRLLSRGGDLRRTGGAGEVQNEKNGRTRGTTTARKGGRTAVGERGREGLEDGRRC